MTVNEFLKRWIMHYVHPEYFYIPWADKASHSVTFYFTLTDNPIPASKYSDIDCIVAFYLYNVTTGKYMKVTRYGDVYRAEDKDYSQYHSGDEVVESPCCTANNQITIIFPQGEYQLIEGTCKRGCLNKTPVTFTVGDVDIEITIPHKTAYTKVSLSDNWYTSSMTGSFTETPYGSESTSGGYGNLSYVIYPENATHYKFVPQTTGLTHLEMQEENSVGITYTLTISPHWTPTRGGVPGGQSMLFLKSFSEGSKIKYTPRNDNFNNDKSYHNSGIGACPWYFTTGVTQAYDSSTIQYDNSNTCYLDVLINGRSYCYNDGNWYAPTPYDVNTYPSGMKYTEIMYHNKPSARFASYTTSIGGDLLLPNVSSTYSEDPHFIGYNEDAERLWESTGGHSQFGNGYVGTYANDEMQTISQSGTLVEQWTTEYVSTRYDDDGYILQVSTSKTDSRKEITYSQIYGWTMEVAMDYDSVYNRIASYWLLSEFGTSAVSETERVIQESQTTVHTDRLIFNAPIALTGLSVMFFRFLYNHGAFSKDGVTTFMIKRNGDNLNIGYENSRYDCRRFDEAIEPAGDARWIELFHLKDVSYDVWLFAQRLTDPVKYIVP